MLIITFNLVYFASFLPFFVNGRARVPIVTCGPGDTLIPHHVDEYLDIDQLITATRLYAVTAMRYLGVHAV